MSNGRNLQIPGQVKVSFRHHPGESAHPAQTSLQAGGNLEVMVHGGLTKLEHGALLVAAGVFNRDEMLEFFTHPDGTIELHEDEDIAAWVVSVTQSVLNECAERQRAIDAE